MENQAILDQVQAFADQAHGAQMRKYVPQRYIVHPLEVMQLCRQYTDDTAILSAALLHDVLEDTPTTPAQLLHFLVGLMDKVKAQRTLDLVQELTDVYTKKAFPACNRRMRKEQERQRLSAVSAAAQTIKYADIISNSIDISRHDRHFAPRFLKEGNALLMAMKDGQPELRKLALETVGRWLRNLHR